MEPQISARRLRTRTRIAAHALTVEFGRVAASPECIVVGLEG